MSIRAIILITFVASCLVATPTPHVYAQNDFRTSKNANDSISSMAVLKNGQVIRGRIIQGAKRTTVIASSGSRIVLDNSRVDFVSSSFDEAYWQKNAQTKATDPIGHRHLFLWCMRNNLLKHARNQIDLLQMMDIKATDLEYLNRQLLVAIDRRQRMERGLIAQKREPNSQVNQKPNVIANGIEPTQNILALPLGHPSNSKSDGNIRLVSFDNAEPSNVTAPATLEDLERTVDSIPPQAVAMFKRRIEPALVRTCYLCHNKPDQPMQLMRLGRNQMIPKRMSQRNLHSIMKYVNNGEPLKSELFRAAVAPHGNQAKPMLNEKDKLYQNLGQWLIMVSSRPNQSHEIPDFTQMESEIPKSFARTNDGAIQNAAPLVADSSSEPIPSRSGSANVPHIPDLNANRKKTHLARDPFDADVFNRKYSKRGPKSD